MPDQKKEWRVLKVTFEAIFPVLVPEGEKATVPPGELRQIIAGWHDPTNRLPFSHNSLSSRNVSVVASEDIGEIDPNTGDFKKADE